MGGRFAFVALLASLPLFVGFDCGGGAAPGSQADVTWSAGNAVVTVRRAPFGLTIANRAGAVLLESSGVDGTGDDADPRRAYAPLALTHNEDASSLTVMYGWSYFRGQDDPWK